MIHNRYQYRGGEDFVFEVESDMLSRNGHAVKQLVFDNKEIKTGLDKMMLALKGVYNSGSAKKIENTIRQFKPDIIHVHNFFPLVSPAVFFVANKYNIPTVVTLHNFRLICPSATLYFNGRIYEENIHKLIPLDAILKGVYRNSRIQTAGLAAITTIHNLMGTWKNRVSKFIVLTEFAKQKFLASALRVSEDQFAIKPNFVEDHGFGEADKREDFFLMVGRLSEEKGIDTLLAACNLGNFKLVIMGDGPLKNQVEKAAANNSNIRYMGFQDKVVIHEYLKRCRALLFPSVWYEGLSIVLLEALSMGTPLIASRLGSMAEVLTDHVNGLHFEPGNAIDLLSKINALSNDSTLAGKLGANARKSYFELYTPEVNYKILLDIYTQLLATQRVSV
jgi:glycosyltransferase involved in cell wall biosynthesis